MISVTAIKVTKNKTTKNERKIQCFLFFFYGYFAFSIVIFSRCLLIFWPYVYGFFCLFFYLAVHTRAIKILWMSNQETREVLNADRNKHATMLHVWCIEVHFYIQEKKIGETKTTMKTNRTAHEQQKEWKTLAVMISILIYSFSHIDGKSVYMCST